MNKIWIIARKDIGEAFRSRSTYIFIVVMIFVTLNYATAYTNSVKTLSSPELINEFSRRFISGLAYILPMMYSIFVCSIFATYSVIVDKAKRNIESLMATPISITQLWLGKSLAVTLPSYVIGLAVSVLAYLGLNFAFVMPNTHAFIFPDLLAILSALVIIPLLIFAIVTIVIHIQLIISNPRIANLIFTAMFILLVIGVNTIGGLGVPFAYFPLAYAGVIALCAAVDYVLSLTLTKEKVLLSSKM
jgi:ABC-type Na+ efflux pump permease subunit